MTSKKLGEAFNSCKTTKKYVAKLLRVSRPTLDKMMKNNSFDDKQVKLLTDNGIIHVEEAVESTFDFKEELGENNLIAPEEPGSNT